MTKAGHCFTPEKTRNAEDELKWLIKEQFKGEPYAADVPLIVNMYFGIPEPKRGKKSPTGRPDLDNYVKLVCDSCNGLLWHDDSQITGMVAMKAYVEKPGILLLVAGVNEDAPILKPEGETP